MKTIAFVLSFLLSSSFFAFAGVSLTQQQYDNFEVIDEEIRKLDPDYRGMNGTRENMEVFGISDTQVRKYLGQINVQTAKENRPQEKKRQSVESKLRALGWDDEMLEYVGVKPRGGG